MFTLCCARADHIIADEFSAELAEGMAYVAGHDDESRPVVVTYMDLPTVVNNHASSNS